MQIDPGAANEYREAALAEQRGELKMAEKLYRRALVLSPAFDYATVSLAALLQAFRLTPSRCYSEFL